jgi:hypothetical protein
MTFQSLKSRAPTSRTTGGKIWTGHAASAPPLHLSSTFKTYSALVNSPHVSVGMLGGARQLQCPACHYPSL